eukprot:TRINITY_DN5693_c0_g3_i1.p2 TRINITY_DN5693_c0_g3~~TRINITY_DN5693_c0_g3_i1.p2  ORF type:complete len:446 (-),score=48.02 TRINITY_DN5693_c0_g3_i1:281-1618(-)
MLRIQSNNCRVQRNHKNLSQFKIKSQNFKLVYLSKKNQGVKTCAVYNQLPKNLEDKFVIVGAGISGLASAVALKNSNIPICVLESSKELPKGGTAIGLWTNAFRALEELKLADEIRAKFPASNRLQIARDDGTIIKEFELPMCDKIRRHELRGVRRSALLELIKSRLTEEDVVFGCEVDRVQSHNDVGDVSVTLRDGNVFRCRGVLGADGVRSKVGESLGLSAPTFRGQYAIRGLLEVKGKQFPILKDCAQTWWGKGVRFGAYSAGENYLYWFVCFNGEQGQRITDKAQIKAEAISKVKDWKVSLADIIQSTPEDNLSRSSLGDRWILPNSTIGQGNISLAGDALHPMTPNLGQGGCTALEDAVVLSKLLAPAWKSGNVEKALREYERRRTSRCFVITLRSFALGAISQSEFPPLMIARDVIASKVPSQNALSHANYDVQQFLYQ